jgi:hypothetical protein
MKQVVAILTSIWSLFVDDVPFAALIVALLLLIYWLVLTGVDSIWHGALLFGGLGLILIHGAWRKIRLR